LELRGWKTVAEGLRSRGAEGLNVLVTEVLKRGRGAEGPGGRFLIAHLLQGLYETEEVSI